MSVETLSPSEAATSTPPPFVDAELTFIHPGVEKPYLYGYAAPEGSPQTTAVYTPQTVRIENARTLAADLSLDREGMAVRRHRSAVQDFWDDPQTLALGHPEAAEIVRAATGAARVVVFDYTRRRQSFDTASAGGSPPAVRVHVDQTVGSGPQRVRAIMGDEAEALLQRRAAIINVWRPIHHMARDWPVAVADASSIAAKDLIASDLLFPHRKGEIYNLTYDPSQRWLYIPDLQPDEALLIKCWDSDATKAQFAPHAGFKDPSTPPGTPPRESIEFRTIAFFD